MPVRFFHCNSHCCWCCSDDNNDICHTLPANCPIFRSLGHKEHFINKRKRNEQKYLYSKRQNSLVSDEAADRTGGGKLSPFTYFIFLLGKYFTFYSDLSLRKVLFYVLLIKSFKRIFCCILRVSVNKVFLGFVLVLQRNPPHLILH